MVTAEGIVVGLIMILIRNSWGYAYSDEVEVVKYVAKIMPILATSNFLNGLQGVLSGNNFIHKLLLGLITKIPLELYHLSQNLSWTWTRTNPVP